MDVLFEYDNFIYDLNTAHWNIADYNNRYSLEYQGVQYDAGARNRISSLITSTCSAN